MGLTPFFTVLADHFLRGIFMSVFKCDGYWKDTQAKFTNVLVSNDRWNGEEDADDLSIFFYTEGDPVVADHGEFVITTATQVEPSTQTTETN